MILVPPNPGAVDGEGARDARIPLGQPLCAPHVSLSLALSLPPSLTLSPSLSAPGAVDGVAFPALSANKLDVLPLIPVYDPHSKTRTGVPLS